MHSLYIHPRNMHLKFYWSLQPYKFYVQTKFNQELISLAYLMINNYLLSEFCMTCPWYPWDIIQGFSFPKRAPWGLTHITALPLGAHNHLWQLLSQTSATSLIANCEAAESITESESSEEFLHEYIITSFENKECAPSIITIIPSFLQEWVGWCKVKSLVY